MTHNFCTHFDHNYLARALVMIDSLRAQKIPFRIWVLCLTDKCKEILDSLKVPEIKSFRLSQLEEDERELLAVKANRNLSEYYFTVSPIGQIGS